ncbi:uncharacterized protein LOC129728540 [Wyeomyia smithii]|uniref:uncharacterized protein LOC129728540 n=1 Tax=Wyeomyia smithii TaxID=174621 RepID=UPI00246807E1|nr:uncharacterized protein LOC129728540 [Wyeomyia smithii]
MQRIWRSGTDWDEQISGAILEEWRKWSDLLARVHEVRVPRCFFPGTKGTSCNSQIHVFVDASENAYACVAYLRSDTNGDIRCTFIEAKTKVAPLKPVSIPRLELQAALIGSRMLENICKALTIPVNARYFWSDSTTVLAWLRSETRRYHQFVGFRVGEILSTTTVDEWRKVPSKINVADQATKWENGPSFDPETCWYTGPSFLRNKHQTWRVPTEKEFSTEEDLRAVFLFHREVPKPLIKTERFSKWSRLLRAAGYVLRAVGVFHGSRIKDPLTQEELQRAETLLWRQTQMQEYADEYATLLYNKKHPEAEQKQIDKSCALYKLSPILDDEGVLRLNSRIIAAPMLHRDTKYPIILPKDQQRYWIPRLRVVVAKVAKQCQICRNGKAVPQAPVMAPLPEIRLTAYIRPFTHTGVDYFGPVFVKQGRSLVKRWIALFTCLSIRAVHLEVVHSLSTQSCVMAIRRFVARRGSPETFFSDNGTNFVGANNLLREQLRRIYDRCAVTFTNSATQWLFNPPLAPHMGGPWERLVRSVKTAMAAIADHPHHPSDEVLETVILEAESVVNSRPLTYIPLEHTQQEALTPNHFLLYGTKGINQPLRDQIESTGTLRDSWKLAQFQPIKPIKPGDLVMIVDGGKRNGWIRGRVINIVKAKDGQVRRALVYSNRGTVNRPVTKLALLDVQSASDEPEVNVSGVPELHGRGDVAEPTVQSSPVVSQQRFVDSKSPRMPPRLARFQSFVFENCLKVNTIAIVQSPVQLLAASIIRGVNQRSLGICEIYRNHNNAANDEQQQQICLFVLYAETQSDGDRRRRRRQQRRMVLLWVATRAVLVDTGCDQQEVDGGGRSGQKVEWF